MPNYAEAAQQPWFDYEDMILHVRVLDGVTTVGDYAFNGFNRLQTMELAASVTFIGYRSFGSCSRIESLELPANLVTIGLSAFEGCSGFLGQAVVLPETVKNIGDKAFMGCGFDSVTLPASLELLGIGVFQSCPNLRFADFSDGCSLTAIPEDSFRDCPNLMLADDGSSVMISDFGISTRLRGGATVTSTSRGLEPSDGPTMPRVSR